MNNETESSVNWKILICCPLIEQNLKVEKSSIHSGSFVFILLSDKIVDSARPKEGD